MPKKKISIANLMNNFLIKIKMDVNENTTLDDIRIALIDYVTTCDDINRIHRLLLDFKQIKKHYKKGLDLNLKKQEDYQASERNAVPQSGYFIISNCLAESRKKCDVFVSKNETYSGLSNKQQKITLENRSTYYIKLTGRIFKLYNKNHNLIFKLSLWKLRQKKDGKSKDFRVVFIDNKIYLFGRHDKEILLMELPHKSKGRELSARAYSSEPDREFIYLIAIGILKIISTVTNRRSKINRITSTGGEMLGEIIGEILSAIIEGLLNSL